MKRREEYDFLNLENLNDFDQYCQTHKINKYLDSYS